MRTNPPKFVFLQSNCADAYFACRPRMIGLIFGADGKPLNPECLGPLLETRMLRFYEIETEGNA